MITNFEGQRASLMKKIQELNSEITLVMNSTENELGKEKIQNY